MNINPVIGAIKAAGPLGIRQAQKSIFVIKVLQNLKLDPAQPPKDFEGVFAYALVEYGIAKSDILLKFFRFRQMRSHKSSILMNMMSKLCWTIGWNF